MFNAGFIAKNAVAKNLLILDFIPKTISAANNVFW